MKTQGLQFPVHRFGDFQAHLRRFLREQSQVPITAMWFDSKGDMTATAFSFKVPPKSSTKVSEILEDRSSWLDYVSAENANSATSASAAWATSQTWAEAEAEHECMSNAWHVALLACGICTIACLLYTWDLAYTAIVVTIATFAMIYLSFFMFCIFQWAVGPWEIILLVAYLMYSVEPALRIGRGCVWGGFLPSEIRIAGNAVTPLTRSNDATNLAALANAEPAPPALAVLDDPGTGDGAAEARAEEMNEAAPAAEGSSNNSPNDNAAADDAAARSAFEGRMHQFVLNVSNATFGSAVKLVLCGIMALPCEFRLFTRLGAVSIMVPLLSLVCIFILVPTALVLLPIREKPDLVSLWEIARDRINASRDA